MATLAVQIIDEDGLDPTPGAAAAGGDNFPNDGRCFLYASNAGEDPITITVHAQRNCSFGYEHDATVVVAAGAEVYAGPYSPYRFNDVNGAVQLTYSAVADLAVAAVQLPRAPTY